MSAPSYSVVALDLSVARDHARIADVGQVIGAVTVLQLPAGSTCALTLGTNRGDIPLLIPAQLFDMCPACDEGIFFTNPAGVGIVILLLSVGDNLTVSNP